MTQPTIPLFRTSDAARKFSAQLDVRILRNGQHAIEWLSGTGVYAERNAYRLPDLVLVDLRMPRVNGFDLLRWVRSRPEFENVPVIVDELHRQSRHLRGAQ